MDNYNDHNDRRLRREDNYYEESAAEVLPLPAQDRVLNNQDDVDVDRDERADAGAGRGMGIFALILSIASFFFLPILLGAAGIIVGFIARRRGANGFGNWAIGLGIASIVISLLFAPFF